MSPATFAAKAATTTIPIVFIASEDPVRLGLVASLARPGGNLTGINIFSGELTAKRLELLRELVPTATRVAVLVNPANATNTETTLKELKRQPAPSGCKSRSSAPAPSARSMQPSQHLCVNGPMPSSSVSTPSSTAGGPNWSTWRRATRSQRSYPAREFAEAGGLMSYGANIADAWRQVGSYAGRILKGAKPADLPVVQSSKFELVINAQTATMLGLTVPPTLLATADEGDRVIQVSAPNVAAPAQVGSWHDPEAFGRCE